MKHQILWVKSYNLLVSHFKLIQARLYKKIEFGKIRFVVDLELIEQIPVSFPKVRTKTNKKGLILSGIRLVILIGPIIDALPVLYM